MKNKLTEKEKKLLVIIRDKWLNKMFQDTSEINKEKAEELVSFLYEMTNLSKPRVIYVDSPLGAQFAANFLSFRNEVGKVRDEVGDEVGKVGDEVWNKVWNKVRDEVGKVWNKVRDEVWNKVWDEVRNEVGKVGDEVWLFFLFSCHGNVLDFQWLSFYDFFEEIGILKHEKFHKFKELLFDSNVYDMIQLKKYCIVCSKPKYIKRDKDKNLHSEDGPAIHWNDGYELYYLFGVHFEKELYLKVINSDISFKEIMEISNIEQRMSSLKLDSNREKL